MKFIGQYIQDFIARFRSDVYLEDISTGTIASGANLGLDSNNKIVKNTVGGGGTTDLTSDVTGVLPIANGGTNSNSAANARTALGVDAAGTDNSTNVTLAGTPDYITISGQEITRNQIDLANDVTGTLAAGNVATLNQNTTGSAASLTTERDLQVDLASTSADGFDGGSNATDIGVKNILAVGNGGTGVASLGSINISSLNNDSGFTANTGDITGVTAGTNLSGGGSSGAVTINLANASESAKGAVELATTGEADTGTDTARAVTPAGLKSHVDARYTYQYISFTSNATTPADGDWMVPSGNGISNHLWNTNVSNGSGGSSNGKTKGSSNITVGANQAGCGIIVPQACVLVGFDAMVRNGSRHANLSPDGDATEYLKDQRSCGVFVGQPTYNDYAATGDLTLRAYSPQLGQGTTGSDPPDTDFYLRICRATDMSANFALSAGDMIVPAVAGTKSDGSHHSGGCIVSWTLVLKTLIP